MKKNKVVLAFSGGLDTSYCVTYLTKELGLEVHAITVNTGGFSKKEIKELEKKALKLGAKSYKSVDATKDYYKKCLRYLLFGNVLRNNTYPLSVSAERMFQAVEVAQYAKKIGVKNIAHGSTGAGNDQVRFDLIFNIMGDNWNIITPIRDQKLSREAEVKYLQKAGFDWSWKKSKYSINEGLWGTSVGGVETLNSLGVLPEEAYPSPLLQKKPQTIKIKFKKGEAIALNGKKIKQPVALIQELQKLAAPYAIGRDIHVGDTIIGIKGRVGFEAAAPLLLIKAHHLLEKHTLTKWQQYWKEQLANWYGMLLHEGQFLDPVLRNIETFLKDSQTYVNGEVSIQLMPYRFELLGIESKNDLMNSDFGNYGEMNEGWTGEDVRGFTKILGNQSAIFHKVNHKKL